MAFVLAMAGCATTAPAPDASGPADAALSGERSEALMQAVLALGDDYRYGGESPRTGFDCSGLVAHVFEQAWGIRLPHSVLAQSRIGAPVSPAQLQPGDLVFYDTEHRPYSHVGIYIGGGRFVHAPKTGTQVRIEDVHSRYWASRFDGARRIQPPP